MSYKAIIFDFDGVLVESANIKTLAFAELYKGYGNDIVNAVVRYHEQHAGVSRYKKFEYFQTKLLNKPYSQRDEEQLSKQFSEIVENAVIQADEVPGALSFLEQQRNKLLYIASATPEAELLRIAKKRGIASYFKNIHGSPNSKKDIIAKVLSDNNLKPSEVLMIGDAAADHEAARFNQVAFAARTTDYNQNVFPNYDYAFTTFKELNIDR